MATPLPVVILVALPASGKSELRRFLASLSPEQARDTFHMGPNVQLDDFPYVHLMRRIDDELATRGHDRVFFNSAAEPFKNPRDWGTLIQLLNEDHADLVAKSVTTPASAAALLFERIDRAAAKVGVDPRLGTLAAELATAIATPIEAEARELLDAKHAEYPETLEGKTIVIECARGGAQGSAMPLDAPFGYQYSLAQLAPAILEQASVLYIWVTPEESRRKNTARTDPNDPGSILHHGVPMAVMLNDYGCDDMDWLEANSNVPGTLAIEAHGTTYNVPIARFDNRTDKTTFIREDTEAWSPADVETISAELAAAMQKLSNAQTLPVG